MIQGYVEGLRGVRLSGGKTRYGQWPFEPRLIKVEKLESSGGPTKPDPSQLPAPVPGAIDQASVEVAWQASPQEDQPGTLVVACQPVQFLLFTKLATKSIPTH